ncbi:YcaO-like family protein [Enhygromyxa salina]|uniref:YcaO-like family protein n=1 Tax=Enhygromyxa salina TaxID=215803 RepID=A0A2S9YT64_9BACT|nr:YcaO-like family protein [Enhygromyxa salina]PRQ08301.1 YcaO-like family protein [Enhygromyxa salina]
MLSSDHQAQSLAARCSLVGSDDPGVKMFRAETHRVVTPAQTMERLRPMLPAMGITRIGNVTGLDWIGVPTVVVYRPNARSLAVSQGKGLTLDAARVSGVMESIEAFHAERVILPMRLGSANDLSHALNLVDIMAIPRTSAMPLNHHIQFLWVQGVDIVTGDSAWVPHEAVHIDSTLQGRINPGIFCCSTNGLASGNHLLEAISYGIAEVIERDSTTLWGLATPARRDATRIDLETVDDPRCRRVLDKFAAAGVATAVWETTSDLGVPAFTCLIVERDEDALRSLHSASGQGCHCAREIALLRALTEAAQTRLTVISGVRDDVMRGEYDRHRNPDQLRYVRQLVHDQRAGERSFQAVPTFSGETFAADISWQLERLRSVGLDQVVVCDLSQERFGIPVVKVVIPGLEGNHDFPKYELGKRARAVAA